MQYRMSTKLREEIDSEDESKKNALDEGNVISHYGGNEEMNESSLVSEIPSKKTLSQEKKTCLRNF